MKTFDRRDCFSFWVDGLHRKLRSCQAYAMDKFLYQLWRTFDGPCQGFQSDTVAVTVAALICEWYIFCNTPDSHSIFVLPSLIPLHWVWELPVHSWHKIMLSRKGDAVCIVFVSYSWKSYLPFHCVGCCLTVDVAFIIGANHDDKGGIIIWFSISFDISKIIGR